MSTTWYLRATCASILWAALASPTAVAQPGDAETPTGAQLTEQLQLVFNTAADSQRRAANLEGGMAALPNANAVGAVMNQYKSMVSWHAEDPTSEGNQLHSTLVMNVGGLGSQSEALAWIWQDSGWKLSNSSLCSLANKVTRSRSCTP